MFVFLKLLSSLSCANSSENDPPSASESTLPAVKPPATTPLQQKRVLPRPADSVEVESGKPQTIRDPVGKGGVQPPEHAGTDGSLHKKPVFRLTPNSKTCITSDPTNSSSNRGGFAPPSSVGSRTRRGIPSYRHGTVRHPAATPTDTGSTMSQNKVLVPEMGKSTLRENPGRSEKVVESGVLPDWSLFYPDTSTV